MLDDKKIVYYRTYSNIINILGDIGGLYSLLFYLGSLLAIPLCSLSLNMTLINAVFNFSTKDTLKPKD
jgi:hypothetical protein